MPDNYQVFLLLALLSEIIGTLSGFGSSILLIPLASLFFDFKNVLAITAVFHVFSNLSKMFLFRNGIVRNITFKMGISAVLMVILGAWLTRFIAIGNLELLMNILLMALAVFMMISFNRKFEQSDRNLYLGGAASGFLAGLAGTGGAIRGLTLAAFNLPKDIFIANSALIDLGVDLSRSFVYIYNQYFSMQYVSLIPLLIVISFAGTWLGRWILKFTSEQVFRYVVLLTVIATALAQIVRHLNHDGI